MARRQLPRGFNLGPFTTTEVQLSGVEQKVTSFIIQAPSTNSDFIKVGGTGEQVYQIAPGKDLEVNGDNLDNGTTGYVDLSQWYVSAVAGTQNCSVTYLERY